MFSVDIAETVTGVFSLLYESKTVAKTAVVLYYGVAILSKSLLDKAWGSGLLLSRVLHYCKTFLSIEEWNILSSDLKALRGCLNKFASPISRKRS